MTLDKLFKSFGNTVYLKGSDDWHSEKYKAFLQPLRYKTKLYMVGDYTPIGVNKNDVYLYIGPCKHDLTKLDSTYRLCYDNNLFSIDRAERIDVKDRGFYIWAIIRKVVEV